MTTVYRKLATVCLAAVLAFGLAACGGGGTTTTEPDPPPPAAIDVERMGISDALAAASAAAGMVTDASTDEEVAAADTAVAAAMAAINGATLISGGEIATSRASLATIQSQLATAKASRTMVMNLASQRMAISSAIAAATTAVRAVMDDSDDATVTAAEDAIAAANRAIAAAGDILASEAATARAEVADLQSDLDTAKASRQMVMDDAAALEARRTAQLSAISDAIDAATTAVGMVDDDATDEQVAAATQAIADATAAIDAAADVSAAVITTQRASVSDLATSLATAVASRNSAIADREVASQRMAISSAIGAARTAVMAVTDTSTDAEVMAADDAITAARAAISAATDVPADELAANTGTVDAMMAQLTTAKGSRMAAMEEAARVARVQAQRKAIDDAIAAAKTAVEAVTDDSTDAEVMAADAAIKAAEDAIAAGTDLPEGDTDTDSETVKMLASTLGDAKTSREVAMGGAARDMRNRIIGKDRAVEGADNLPGTAANGMPTEAQIVISRAAGKTASVSVSGAGAPAGYKSSDTPAMENGSWAGRHLERNTATATQHLFVYTDKEAPTRIQFYDFDGDSATPHRYTDTSPPGTDPYTATTTITPLALTGNLLSRGNLDDNFMSPGPAEDGNVTQRFRVASAQSTTHSFKGNFNGAAGTYTCTTTAGVDCRITITPTGTYTPASGQTWTFTPELNSTAWVQDGGTVNSSRDGVTTVMVGEFMSFGWWMQEPNSPNGTYTFRYYADGSPYTVPTTANALATGSATYSGRAAGKYVVQTIDDSGVTGGMASQFTAAATLTATFGEDSNSIGGTISGITAEDGSSPGWEVTLHEKDLGDRANLASTTAAAFPDISETDPERSAFDGVTATIGDQTAYGDWDGQYFGDKNNGNTVNAYPLGVGGTFQADNERVSIGGAFGARRP